MERSAPRARALPLPCWLAWLAVSAGLLTGCGGGGDASASTAVVVSGAVTFDKVPVVGLGLDYDRVEQSPARGLTVEAVRDGDVLDSTTTDEAGRYALELPPNIAGVKVRVSAEMRRAGTPAWDYRVVDNTEGDALYVLESAEFATEEADLALDLHAASGWDGAAYTGTRSAAPFAILDVVYDATQFVLSVAPDTVFPPLVLHWSADNVPSRGADGVPDFATGEIGSSLFRPGAGIYLLGAEDSDTDEYDRHVIAHEWAHFFENALARSDSIGGPHTRGDQLDMRTAFSEGFANAVSAMITGDKIYTDVLGPGQASGFAFDVEGPFVPQSSASHPNPNPGWFSEESVQEIVYDLFDAAQGADEPEDTVALGFGPIFDVMTADIRETPALTSIFAFIDALKRRVPAVAEDLNALVEAHAIAPVADAYGSGEDNFGTPTDPTAVESDDILPIYKDLAVGLPVTLCSTDAYNYGGVTGSVNKLGSRAFLKLAVPDVADYAITATTVKMPAGATADPDMILYRSGPFARSEDAPDDAACTVDTPSGCVERFEASLGPGDYVLEVYEWTNTQPDDGDHPPIGRTCFEVEITAQ
ncbi:MAG TPA: hypothetical protein VF329_07505 [Gammaproteobacteria bacterium]